MLRRAFLALPAAAAAQTAAKKSAAEKGSAVKTAARAGLGAKERVNRALRGAETDRPPFTFWYHFGLEKYPFERHVNATLEFHRKFRTDLVKVMSDYAYPKPKGKWYELKVEGNPFPEQIKALEAIHDGLAGRAHFVETIFNSWTVAEKLSSKEEVLRMKDENPRRLLAALEMIAESQTHHARKAVEAGASGIFLAVANAQEGVLSRADYAKFSEPFDRLILKAVDYAPLNTLHLHGEKVYMDLFYSDWPVAAINYSAHATGVGIGELRQRFSGLIMAGIDEVKYRTLADAVLKKQWQAAQEAAGKRFLLSPGCSVPNETTDEEMLRLTKTIRA